MKKVIVMAVAIISIASLVPSKKETLMQIQKTTGITLTTFLPKRDLGSAD